MTIGVTKHYITPYLRTLGRHNNNLFPSMYDYNNLTNYINNYKGKMLINYKEPNFSDDIELGDCNRCTGGRMGIVINPNGMVSICERLIDAKECIVGNIRNKSLKEIWEGEELYNLLNPSKELFRNTECFDCNHFEECVLDKGLCYARCKIVYGGIYQQDPLCPFRQEKIRFV